MRKLLTAVLAAAFMVGLACMAYAAEVEGGYSVKGQVVSIDPAGRTIVISTAEGEKTIVFQEGTKGFSEVKPGMSVEMTCIDLEGKACAKDVRIISAAEAAKPVRTFEGQVVSIDPEGKTVVIKSPKGEEMTITVATPTVQRVSKKVAPSGQEEMVTETVPVTELKPGMAIKADCFDFEGKFCASKITVVPYAEAGKPVPGAEEVVGEVVSIDSEGKSIVVKTVSGPKTLYYQPTTAGPAPSELEVGKKVKAYCLDVEGKSCIRDIGVVTAP